MKENKNIERLFQEKFKDFEVSPPEVVWENIEEKLNPKEKKRRVIPFWWKATGIAASFVAIVSVVFFNMQEDTDNLFINKNSKNNNAVVNTEGVNSNNTSNQNAGTNESNSSENNQNQKASNSSNSTFKDQNITDSKSNSLVNNKSNNEVSNSKSKLKSDSKFNQNEFQNSKTNSSNSLVNNKASNSKSNLKSNSKFNQNVFQNSKTNSSKSGLASGTNKLKQTKNFKKNKASFTNSNSAIVANDGNRDKFNTRKKTNTNYNKFNASKNNKSDSGIYDFNSIKNKNSNSELTDLNKFNKTNSEKNSNSNLIDIKQNTNINSEKNSGITNSIENKTSTDLVKNNGVLVENNIDKNSIINAEAIAALEQQKIDTITLATINVGENPMEKLLREKETKKVADEKEKRSKWAVNSYVSPIFFNSFADGSPLSDEFAANEKNFKNSTSYGVGVAYNLSKRLSIKTGVTNLNLDYDTESIAFYSTYEDQSKIANTNIERNANGKFLVLKHEKDVSKNAVENMVMQTSQNSGTLNQKLQYIEVPVEMSYALLNKKFGVAIRGGMSTLFLTENVVSITSTDGNMQIGKASNLNNVHFSSNIGLGLNYSFMKNFQLNVEPTLKYQLNTFNKNSENFTPYVIGINTGISYKF